MEEVPSMCQRRFHRCAKNLFVDRVIERKNLEVKTNSTAIKNSLCGKFMLFVIWTHLFYIVKIQRDIRKT